MTYCFPAPAEICSINSVDCSVLLARCRIVIPLTDQKAGLNDGRINYFGNWGSAILSIR